MDALERAWSKLGLPGATPIPWYYPSIAEYSELLEEHGLEVTFATLFDRPTPLEDGERGLRSWLEMFGGAFSEKLSPDQRGRLFAEVEEQARRTLWREGQWVMDYRRLRIVAWKK